MRRTAVILSLLILTLSLAGCGTNNRPSSPEARINANEQSPGGGSSFPGTASESTASSQTPQSSIAQTSGVVAKSNNAVSGQEKEALLNELDKELDSLFSNIDRMEDVQESDLQLN
ncbi:MAG: hypothetical protein QHH06_04650 [Clostridiales bacterium]|jgi:hypothetical protein|nr:hypothetical protein [Eubacteriales bacterium]MDH7565757.1 hypothetical protein [Clostridiales bacterium]